MKKTILSGILFSSAVAVGIYACGGGDNGGANDAGQSDHTTSSSSGASGSGSGSSGGSSSGSSGSGGGSGSGGMQDSGPPPPTLGRQVDRMGRPAINTALYHSFDANAATAGAAKDTYNADSLRPHWTSYQPELEKSLAIFDAIDGTCGNQASYNAGYSALSSYFVDDALWVNTESPACDTYLGVELNALAIQTNADCGGRTLTENAIDVTYNLLVSGQVTGLTNGVTQGSATPSDTFPYLASPH